MAKSWLDSLREYVGKKNPDSTQTRNGETASPIVAATDYTAAKGTGMGVPVNAQWRDGKVSVGGVLVEPEYVKDGKAFVRQEQMDDALGQVKQATGIKSGQEILDRYQGYADQYNTILGKIENRQPFSYDPEQDAVFASYKNQYNREGSRATENTMGIYAGLTGGMANSSAVTAAAQAGQYWSDKLMDVIPELAEGAYDRYLQEFEMDRKVLSDIMDVDNHLFDREYGVNRDSVSDYVQSQKTAQERDEKINQLNWNKEQAGQELDYKKNRDQQELDYKKEHDEQQFEYQKEKDEKDRQQKNDKEVWERAFKIFEASGEVPNEQVAQVLGIPEGQVTEEMKRFVEDWKHQKEMANLKHDYTMKEIEKRNQK